MILKDFVGYIRASLLGDLLSGKGIVGADSRNQK